MSTGANEHVCEPQDFTRCVGEGATTRAQDRPVSRRRTSSGLHSCRCEATNTECLKVDGQRHRNIHPSWQAASAPFLTVQLLNSHVEVVFSFCNVKLLCRGSQHLWLTSQRGTSLISHLLTRRWNASWWDEKKWNHQLRSKFLHPVN